MARRALQLFVRTFALLFVVGALAGGCKKKVEPPPPPPPPVVVKLAVTSISPGVIPPNTPTAAKVFGAAFEPGASVSFVGGGSGSEVQVLDGNTIAVRVPGLPKGVYDVVVTNPSGDAVTLRQGLTVKSLELSCKSATINFAFDDAGVTSDGRGILSSHSACYQSEAGRIRIEGHCDERGTVDYNVALGQRRADATKAQLTSMGVSASKIDAVTMGEERPADPGHNEGAWARNRRAEIQASE